MKFFCVPVLKEARDFVCRHKYLLAYFDPHFNKLLLLLKSTFSSRLIISRLESNGCELKFLKTISFLENEIIEEEKIVCVDDLIIVLDKEGNLWKLVDEVQSEGNQLSNKTNAGFWIPFEQFKELHKVLDIKVVGEKLYCLGMTVDSEMKLQVVDSGSSVPLSVGFTLQHLDFCNCVVKIIQAEAENVAGSGIIFVQNRQNGMVYLCMKFRKYLISVNKSPLINTVALQCENCLLFAFGDGKVLFVFVSNQVVASTAVVNFSKKIVAIERCNLCNSCVIWSDEHFLYHTSLKISKSFSVKCCHLKVSTHVRNIMSFVSIPKGFLLKTQNNMFYQVMGGVSNTSGINPDELLTEIQRKTMEMDLLNKKVKNIADYLKNYKFFKELNFDASEFFQVHNDRTTVTLKSMLKVVLRKSYWKVRVAGSRWECKESVEVVDLDCDLSEGTTVKFESGLLPGGQVLVSLIGDFGNEFNLLFIDVGRVGEKIDDERRLEVGRNLEEIAAGRTADNLS